MAPLHAWKSAGWIRATGARDRRQPYAITGAGRQYLEAQVTSLDHVVKVVQRRLKHA